MVDTALMTHFVFVLFLLGFYNFENGFDITLFSTEIPHAAKMEWQDWIYPAACNSFNSRQTHGTVVWKTLDTSSKGQVALSRSVRGVLCLASLLP